MKIAVVLPVLTCLLGGASASFIVVAPSSSSSSSSDRTTSQLTRLFSSVSRKPFITGNWKLNPSTRQEAVDLATGIANSITSESPCDVALFVPFPFIGAVSDAVGGKLIVGAEVCQNVYVTVAIAIAIEADTNCCFVLCVCACVVFSEYCDDNL
jgi:hypothetical protein